MKKLGRFLSFVSLTLLLYAAPLIEPLAMAHGGGGGGGGGGAGGGGGSGGGSGGA